jgi:hypothetical protein
MHCIINSGTGLTGFTRKARKNSLAADHVNHVNRVKTFPALSDFFVQAMRAHIFKEHEAMPNDLDNALVRHARCARQGSGVAAN